jgi:TPR repeat protein
MASRPTPRTARHERCVVIGVLAVGAAFFPACDAPPAKDPSNATQAGDGCFTGSPSDLCADVGDDAMGFGPGALADLAAHPTDRSLAKRAYVRGCYIDGPASWVACSRILALQLAGDDPPLEGRAIQSVAISLHGEEPRSLATDALRRTIASNTLRAARIPVDMAAVARRAREIVAKEAEERPGRPWAFQVLAPGAAHEESRFEAPSSIPDTTARTQYPTPPANVARDLDSLTVAFAASQPRLSRWLGIAFPSVPMPADAMNDPTCDETCSVDKYLCKSGVLTDCERMARAYAVGAGVARDPARAVAIDQAICDTDPHFGCRELAWRYMTGRGVPKSALRGLTLMRRACDAKQAPACEFVVSWDRQHPSAPPALPTDVLDDPRCTDDPSCKTFREACSRGAPTCIAFGNAYRTGAEGVPRDLPRAAKIFQATCEVDPAACATLALMYWTGEGFPVDKERAMTVARKACEEKVGGAGVGSGAEACYRVGTWGDKAYALAHLSTACDANEPQSCGFLADEPATQARGLARLRSMCDAKNAVACETLADLEKPREP